MLLVPKPSQIHSFLQRALDAVAPAARPPGPHHGGVAAKPELGRLGNTGVAIFLAETVAPKVAVKERKRFADWLTAARTVYDRQARCQVTHHKGVTWRTRSLSQDEKTALQRSLELEPKTMCYTRTSPGVLALSPALHIANAAALLAWDLEMGGGGPYANVAVGDAIRHAVALVADPRAFIDQLDRVMLREELRSLVWQRNDPRAPDITACVWRAAANHKTSHSLGTLATGDYLLVFKAGSRWRVFSGPRDEVLATVPDPHFTSAVEAAESGPASR